MSAYGKTDEKRTRIIQSMEQVARDRIAKAKPDREKAFDAIQSGRPLEAEPNMARKVHRIQAVTGVGAEQAMSLVRYEESGMRGLSGEARLAAERIQGKTVDFVSVSFLDLARAAANCVGRVVFNNLDPLGSGFMISEQLFLTNNHVIPDKETAQRVLLEFNYEMDVDSQPKSITRYALNPDKFFVSNPETMLDFTIVAIGQQVNGSGKLYDFGYCPLLATDDKHSLGEFVNIIQHPEGRYKEVILRENQLVTRLETVLHYVADTLPGSSGSPVFNDEWEVIALHHWGEPTILTAPDGRKVRKDVNEGVRISAIVKAITSIASSTNSSEIRGLLEEALNPKSRRPSSLLIRSPEYQKRNLADSGTKPSEHPRPTIDLDESVT